jgi:hypothetical protein
MLFSSPVVPVLTVQDVPNDPTHPHEPATKGMHDRSICILTSSRVIKFTATSRERHRNWLLALSSLQQKQPQKIDPAGVPMASILLNNKHGRAASPASRAPVNASNVQQLSRQSSRRRPQHTSGLSLKDSSWAYMLNAGAPASGTQTPTMSEIEVSYLEDGSATPRTRRQSRYSEGLDLVPEVPPLPLDLRDPSIKVL